MTDLPQHAAQVSLLLELLSGNEKGISNYEVRWFTPYLVPYLFTALLACVFEVVVACKITVSVAIFAIPWLTRRLLVCVGGHASAAWPAMLGSFGFSYQWGFLSFMLASALLLSALPLLLSYSSTPNFRKAVALTLAVVVLFFSHALVFGFFVLLCAATLLIQRDDEVGILSRIRLVVPLFPALPLSIAWVVLSRSHSSVAYPPAWDLGWMQTTEAYYNMAEWLRVDHLGFGRLAGFFVRIFGFRDPLLSAVLGGAVLAWPFTAGMRLRRLSVLYYPIFLSLIFLFLAPSFAFGTAFVFQRFSLFFLPFYGLLFEPRGQVSRGVWMLPAIFLLWFAWVVCSHWSFRQGVQDFERVSAVTRSGEVALGLVFEREDFFSIAPTWIHFPVWQISRGGMDVSPNFAATHIQLVTYKPGCEPKESVNRRFEWRPRGIVREPIEAGRYDYFFVRSAEERTDFLRAGVRGGFELVARSGSWWLYRSSTQ